MLGSPDNGVPILKTDDARRRRLVMPLFIAALAALLVLGLLWNRGNESTIVGAGSTLAAPLVERTATDYRNAFGADNPQRPDQTGGDWVMDGTGLGYEQVGSLGGLMRLDDPEVDFAISDYPLSQQALDERKLGQFPLAAGSLALAHRLDLGGKMLKLDAATVAGIYDGTITRWNDPKLVALNPGTTLPATAIVPVHRADGSGSTAGLTRWLSAEVLAWKKGPGTGPRITWPDGVGKAADKSRGVLDAVKKTQGAITYAESGQALAAGLQVAQVKNGAGEFVVPDRTTMAAALAGMDFSGDDRYTQLVPSADAAGAYPITLPIVAVLKQEPQQRTDAKRALAYLRYVLADADAAALKLGYLPLPDAAVEQVTNHLSETFPYYPART